MRTLLRSIRSGEYLQTFETWTATAGTALDFESISRALDLVRRRGLKDMELVLTDDPAQQTIMPVAKLDYAPTFIEVEAPERKPRLKKLAVKKRKVTAAPAARKRKSSKTSSARRKSRGGPKARKSRKGGGR